ncbi:MAG: nitrogen regulation protein NR(I) [Arenicellales bacterium]|nr:nitrogen regulation protein NR(I) [Arenicellales bacterium]
MNPKVWVVDDDASIRWVLHKACDQAGIDVELFEDGNDLPVRLHNEKPATIVTDIRMPGINGLELLNVIRKQATDVPVIIMTAHTDLDSAVASYQGGAFEYLPKPFDVDDAVTLIRRAIEFGEKESEVNIDAVRSATDIIGEAPAMQEVFRAIGRLANSHINVLIWGESGTGKELVASALHRHSPRSEQPFIAINTAAIPADLLESELFGHEKGAFTGAVKQHRGRFEQAHGGTLFLDEIGDMPAELQTRLLRVLSDKKFYRVGGHEQIEVDVRIIAATNQDLSKRVSEGRFREDLFHRLNVIHIALPPLRQRGEDIPLLTKYFLDRSASELGVDRKTLSSGAMRALSAFDWPGNVRQLENVCRWVTVMAPGQTVSADQLPAEIKPTVACDENSDWQEQLRTLVEKKLKHNETNLLATLGTDFEKTLLETAMKHTGGHKQEAAKYLGWGRNTLARKLKELGID